MTTAKAHFGLFFVAVGGLFISACSSDMHVFHSSVDRPTTITLYDTTSDKPLWIKNIPVGYSLEMDLNHPNDSDMSAVDPRPATQMVWRLFIPGQEDEPVGDPYRSMRTARRSSASPQPQGRVMIDAPAPMVRTRVNRPSDSSDASAPRSVYYPGLQAQGVENLPGTPVVIKVSYRPSPEFPPGFGRESASIDHDQAVPAASEQDAEIGPIENEPSDPPSAEPIPVPTLD